MRVPLQFRQAQDLDRFFFSPSPQTTLLGFPFLWLSLFSLLFILFFFFFLSEWSNIWLVVPTNFLFLLKCWLPRSPLPLRAQWDLNSTPTQTHRHTLFTMCSAPLREALKTSFCFCARHRVTILGLKAKVYIARLLGWLFACGQGAKQSFSVLFLAHVSQLVTFVLHWAMLRAMKTPACQASCSILLGFSL